MTLKDAVSRFIKDGDNIGIGGFVNIRQPVAITHEMVRQGFKDITLSFQSAGMAPDILAGGMIVKPDHCSIKRIELAYWAHEAFGLSPAWRYLAERGLVEFEDWSNYNMSARFEAGAMGLPLRHGLPLSVGDSRTFTGASYVKGLNAAFELTQRGFADVGFIGGAEVDMQEAGAQHLSCPSL
jgi:acyl CoA:acetate/3-ketoacid CoA transferase alpha subunit